MTAPPDGAVLERTGEARVRLRLFQKALEDLYMWQEQEESLPEVLPPEVLGWLLLRRSNITHQERLSVQAAAGNSLRIDDIEKALRST